MQNFAYICHFSVDILMKIQIIYENHNFSDRNYVIFVIYVTDINIHSLLMICLLNHIAGY